MARGGTSDCESLPLRQPAVASPGPAEIYHPSLAGNAESIRIHGIIESTHLNGVFGFAKISGDIVYDYCRGLSDQFGSDVDLWAIDVGGHGQEAVRYELAPSGLEWIVRGSIAPEHIRWAGRLQRRRA